MKMNKSKNTGGGPSSAMGIMRFNDALKSPQFSPESVVVFIVIVIVVVVIIKAAFGI
jgi:preprotein translocase subunit Sec61beta